MIYKRVVFAIFSDRADKSNVPILSHASSDGDMWFLTAEKNGNLQFFLFISNFNIY